MLFESAILSTMRSLGTKLLYGLVAFLLVPSLAMAQEGRITGEVTATDTDQILPGASVRIVDTQLGTATDVEGEYELTGVEPGEHTIRVSFVGYRNVERTVTVEAGETTTANFELQPTAKNLEEIVVTGVSAETPQAKLSFTVDQVSSQALEEVPASNPMSALQGKMAGVNIVGNSGAPGAGSSVRLRGSTSLFGENDPLFIVDGTILGADQVDLGTLDIKNIEVVKGAAASSLYGSRAQNGVVNITTKRGSEAELGQTRVTVRSEVGISDLPGSPDPNTSTELATNENNQIVNASGEAVNWPNGAISSAGPNGKAFRDAKFSNLRRADGSPYEINNAFDQFFNAGNSTKNFIAISQNREDTNFRLSFTDTREQGPIQGDEVSTEGFKRQNFRLNLDHRVNEDIEVRASGFFSTSTNDNPDNIEQSGFDPFFSLMFVNPLSDLTERDEDGQLPVRADEQGLEENPLFLLEESDRVQDRSRFIGNIQGEYSPVDWFTVDGTVSFDRSDRDERLFFDKSFKCIDACSEENGTVFNTNTIEEDLNADITLSYQDEFGEWTTRAQAKFQIEDSEFETNNLEGSQLAAAGIPATDNVTGEKSLSSFKSEVRSKSGFLNVAGDYGDRYIVDLLVRRDGSSLFGPEERWQTFGRASASYRISEEPFWNLDAISEAKVRYSYGTAGGRPSFEARFETFNLDDGNLSKSTLGNDRLKPELQTEQELGLDLGIYDRVFVDLTYVDTEVEDQIVEVPLPAAVGFSAQFRNAGTLESETWEANVTADLIRSRDLNWSIGGNFARTRQEITEFGANPFRTGPEDRFRFGAGEELGNLFGNRWVETEEQLQRMGFDPSKFDKNDDGFMVPVGEGNSFKDGFNGDANGCTAEGCWGTTVSTSNGGVRWGHPIKFQDEDGNQIFDIGNTVPNFNLNFNTTINYKGLSLYALVSHQNDGDVYNFTKQWAFRDGRHADQDQSERPQELKKPVSYDETLYDATNPNQFFVEDATFTKLREASIGYTFDESRLNELFGPSNPLRKLTVRFVGRNLLTFTDYSGIDPEVGDDSGGPGQNSDASLFRVDNFDFPNTRTFRGSVEIQF